MKATNPLWRYSIVIISILLGIGIAGGILSVAATVWGGVVGWLLAEVFEKGDDAK